MMRPFAVALAMLLGGLPLAAGAEDLSSRRDYSDPAQRDLPIACKQGDIEKFPGKSLGDVLGADWPAQPVASNEGARSAAALVERGPMRWPRGMDPQQSFTVVAVLIDASGKPLRAEILCTTRLGFDAAVKRHAMASTYAPAHVDGKSITSALVRVVSFRAGEPNFTPKPRNR